MTCEACQKDEATVHMTQVISGKMQKIDLCEKCAKEKGVADPGEFTHLRTPNTDISNS